MSFYFQPPIFAVQPAILLQATLYPPLIATGPVHLIPTPPPPAVPIIYYPIPPGYVTQPQLAQVTTRPVLETGTSLEDRNSHIIKVRAIFYGHGRTQRQDTTRRIWFRATDSVYETPPSKLRLSEDITSWAGRHGLRNTWVWARLHLLVPGATADTIAVVPELGPVLNDDVCRVVEILNTNANGGQSRECRGVSDAEVEDIFKNVTRGPSNIILTVCLDDEEIAPSGDISVAIGTGEREIASEQGAGEQSQQVSVLGEGAMDRDGSAGLPTHSDNESSTHEALASTQGAAGVDGMTNEVDRRSNGETGRVNGA